jgi:serine/threonine protein kinase
MHIKGSLKDSSPGLRDLIVKMLAIRPDERPSALEALNHPWVQNQDYDEASEEED